MKIIHVLSGCALCVLLLVGCTSHDDYHNAALPIEKRVESLLSQMTLEEKIGQMTQINYTMISAHDSVPILDTTKLLSFVRTYHIGSFLNGIAVSPQQWFEFSDQLQHIAMRESRLHIPIIYGVDHMHGASYVSQATIFPHNINISATFNDDFVRQMAEITARESADLGHHWIFAPVLDVGVQPYWSRLYETFGEDPHVAATMGALYVTALQNDTAIAPYKLAACAKHFLGYSDPKSGWDRTTASIPNQRLHEVFRPSFQAAIDAGISTVMINSSDINGEPVHASKRILTDLLRTAMGFQGVAVTDWEDIRGLVFRHKIAENEKQATLLALNAGIDMAMTPFTTDFCRITNELVREGAVSEERINTSVRRILRLKFALGLFEHPYPRNDRFSRIGAPEHRQKALEAARESLVLLKNTNAPLLGSAALPFPQSVHSLFVVGTSATSRRNLGGGWSLNWEGPRRDDDPRYPIGAKTIVEGLQTEFPNAVVEWMDGIGAVGSALRAEFAAKAKRAEYIIVATGEIPYAESNGNISDLSLDSTQSAIVTAVQQTGKPNVLVLVEGRPRLITPFVENASAILWAGLPGYEGGQAIAEVLSGKTNPSGKLSVSYPKFPGHCVPYHHTASERSTALFPFGYGLSYSSFEYSNLTLSDSVISGSNHIVATVTVTNKSQRTGKEAVLWFVSDEVGSISRPVKLLKHYEKQELQPNQRKTFTFEISPTAHLSFPDGDGKRLLEAGYFTVSVGNLTQSVNRKRFFYNP